MDKWSDSRVIAITAATTTNRYRRGENHAFIAIGELVTTKEWINGREEETSRRQISVFHLKLSKLSMKEYDRLEGDVSHVRHAEDAEIAEFALKLAFGTFAPVEV